MNSFRIPRRALATGQCRIKQVEAPNTPEYRYHFKTYEQLCGRVARYAASLDIREDVENAMLERRFCPAGNTLLAGLRPIRPNCSILPTVTDRNLPEIIERSRRLWRHYTGIGFDLSGCVDPVRTLQVLMEENRKIEFEDRCQRGNMAVVSARHPRSEEFVVAKAGTSQATKLYGFNISLAFDCDENFESLLKEAEIWKTGLLWKAAVAARCSGCPGLVFSHRFRSSPHEVEVDKLTNGSIPPINTTVPCGEQGMREDETCNLGVINLASPHHRNDDGSISLEKIRQTTDIAVRFLDGVVDQLQIDDDIMLQRTRQLRRIGLGVTGFADVLAEERLPYDSQEARQLGRVIASAIARQADSTSRLLATELGPFLPGASRRNVTITCCQPTGNVTLLLGTKGYSIEPMMAEATKIHWRDHLAMQAVWQEQVENAVSKTVNLPNEATTEDVLGVFREAFLIKSIKGVAVYRDGSRQAQPLRLDSTGTSSTSRSCATCQ